MFTDEEITNTYQSEAATLMSFDTPPNDFVMIICPDPLHDDRFKSCIYATKSHTYMCISCKFEGWDGRGPTLKKLPPDEWRRMSERFEEQVKLWMASDDGYPVARSALTQRAAQLYGLNEHDAELCFELMMQPMRAPRYHDAAITILASMAVDQSGILWLDDKQINFRNMVWAAANGCWCWGKSPGNPDCPQHRKDRA